MVALQILALSVRVRILLSQLFKKALAEHSAGAFSIFSLLNKIWRIQYNSDTVSSTIAKTKVKTETIHTFLALWEIAKMAEEKTRTFNAVLATACGMMLIWVIVGLFAYFNIEEYWGRQYWGIYSSKYITEAEKKAIHDNASTYSIVPKEFYSNKSLAKSKIRRNKEILSRAVG